MKPAIFSLALLLSAGAFAQTIDTFYPLNSGTLTYTAVTSAVEFDEGNEGQNIVWNFTNLEAAGASETVITEPTNQEMATYGGVNTVVVTQNDIITSKLFLAVTNFNGGVKVTGAYINNILLTYTHEYDMGTFPISYGGYLADGDVQGWYTLENVYGGEDLSGSFNGSGITWIDAYGTLNLNTGENGAIMSYEVARLKSHQYLTIFNAGLQIGGIEIEINSYYAETPEIGPVFRTTTTTIGIDDDFLTKKFMESYYMPTMALSSPEATTGFAIAPNPVSNTLHIAGTAEITGVTVIDNMGRVVLKADKNDVDVSSLSAGVYHVSVEAGNAVTSLKMVKQ